jgi:(R,R)-butanediol dehydrogenase / meso-butanediol dehydrogenase / diacetyl reductase
MRAARFWGRRDVRLESIDDPGPPPPGWVRLAIDACGICGTDVEEYVSGPTVVPVEPHPLTGRCAPVTLGHEFVGTVDDVGDTDLRTGTRVAVEGTFFCGECWWCRRRDFQLCERMAAIGFMADGGLAEYALVPAQMCFPYPDDVSSLSAVLAEPLSVALRAVDRGNVEPGAAVGILGCGTIGLLTVQAVRRAGAGVIIAVDPVESRLALAQDLGATAVATPQQMEEIGRELTAGVGPDVVVEAAGNSRASADAVAWVRKGGRAVLLGVSSEPFQIDPVDMLMGEKEVVTSLSHRYDTDFARAVEMIAQGGAITTPLVTDTISLDAVVTEGLEVLLAEPEAHLKVVVEPGARR